MTELATGDEVRETIGLAAEVLEMYSSASRIAGLCGCGAPPTVRVTFFGPRRAPARAQPPSFDLGLCVTCAHDLTRLWRGIPGGLTTSRWRWTSTRFVVTGRALRRTLEGHIDALRAAGAIQAGGVLSMSADGQVRGRPPSFWPRETPPGFGVAVAPS